MRTTLALVVLLAVPAAAQAPGPTLERLDVERGWVGGRVHGEPGAQVVIRDASGAPDQAVTLDAAGKAEVPRLAPWRCDPRDRSFTATAGGVAGPPLSLRTPSCAGRFAVRAPRRVVARREAVLWLRDRWGHHDHRARVCLAGACARASTRGRATLRPRHAGRSRLSVEGRRRGAVRVLARPGRLRVLAAGDSMIQYVNTELGARIRGARLRSDDHISTGISKPRMLDWPRQAERVSRSFRPDASVVFLGANDGFPIAGEPCCSDAWVRAYAARVGRMMRAYAREGAGAVYWLTLPVPRRAGLQPIYRAVNRAVTRAAARREGLVRVIDTARVFTPGGRYRSSMRWNGRTRTVRQSDGVHLNQHGAAIAAQLVIRAMRRDRVLP